MSVSVIVPMFDAEQTLERAVASALAQTHPPDEIVLVDDCSTDRTMDIARALASADGRIRLRQNERNLGPSASRNAGISEAAGERVAILDADDAWKPDRLGLLLAAMDRSGCQFVADNLILYDAFAGREGRLGYVGHAGGTTAIDAAVYFRNCLRDRFQFSLLKPLLDKRFIDERGLRYDEAVRYGEDLLFYGELFLSGAKGLLLHDGYYLYTTRMGEFSGQRSPHSKSSPDFRPMAAALKRQALRAPPAAKAAIDRCVASLETTQAINDAREVRRKGRYLQYALAICRPAILGQMLSMRLAALRARLRFRLLGQSAGAGARR